MKATNVATAERKFSRLIAAALLWLACGTLTATAQDGAQDIVLGQRFVMSSKVLGEERRYLIYLPPSYHAPAAAERRYPVLYLLDGGAHFYAATGVLHHLGSPNSAVLRVPETIVVALPNTKRVRDLTPIHLTSGLYTEGSGGATAFLRFMKEELFPLIELRYRTRSGRTLVGHSLAGMFALNVLLEQPDLFQHYIAIDPSLWWGDQLLVRRLAEQPERKLKAPVSVFIAMANSSIEEYSDPTLRKPHEEGIQQFHALLQQRQDSMLRVQYRFYPDETHMSVPLVATYHGLLFSHEGFKSP